jgi:hypothetical protein
MTARHSPLFTLRSGQSGLGIYTSQRDAASGQHAFSRSCVGQSDALSAGFCEAVNFWGLNVTAGPQQHWGVIFRVSERIAWRVAGQHRSTQRQAGKVVEIGVAKLRRRLREIAAEQIRWGRRMAYHGLRREEGLQRSTPRKQKRVRPGDDSVCRHQAWHRQQVWAMEFQFDAATDGSRLKVINVIDEHTRLCLPICVGRSCRAKDVVAVLMEFKSLYPPTAFIRSDSGPEFNCFTEALRLRRCSGALE